MTPTFSDGIVVRVSGEFRDHDGTLTDPAVVTFRYREPDLPDDEVVTLTYGTDSELVRDEAGRYHVDLDTDEKPGLWKWRFRSTGVGKASMKGEFFADRSEI